MQALDTVVIGAGVVGLAVARALARAGREVLVLEAEARAGEGVSSRNSGVIHAGFYYPPGSLKAQLCVRGRDLLYAYCAERGIWHRRTGKLVVATRAEELPQLRELERRAALNAVGPVQWLDAAAARALEPELHCVAALEVPISGVLDVAEYVMALLGDVEHHGGQVVCHSRVQRVNCAADGFVLFVDDAEALRCRHLVNAAGLGAQALAQAMQGFAPALVPPLHYASGHYYRVHGKAPFQRLIYPLPGVSGLGVHLGFDAAQQPRFGPDVRFTPQLDYQFDDSRRGEFAASIRAWWPALRDEDLLPDFVGVRPKLVGPGQPNPDFVVMDAAVHGIPGLVQLFGIESPGLTSSLALGEYVAQRVEN